MNLATHPYVMRMACALLAMVLSGCLAHHQGAMPGEPEDATFAPIEDARVRYVDVNKEGKAPVVLVHGFAASLNTWGGIIPVLTAQGHRVIALDLKGFGWTDRPRGDYSPEAQGELILGLLEHLEVKEPVAIVAHSWGSSVALATILQAPDRFRRLVLYDAWVYAEQLPTFFLWSRTAALGEVLFALFYKEQPGIKISGAFYDKTIITEALVEDVEAQLDRPGTRAAALAAVRGQRYELVQDRYSEVDQPTLLLWGREDQVTPLWVGEKLVRQLPNAELEVFGQCGHFPMIEAYHPSTDALAAFLAKDLEAPATTTPVDSVKPVVEPVAPAQPDEDVSVEPRGYDTPGVTSEDDEVSP